MIIQILEQKFLAALHSAFPHLSETSIEITAATQKQFGHYQCNAAMKLTKILKMPPQKIAAEIINHLNADDIFEKTEIAGPGFINITLTTAFLEKELNSMLLDPMLGVEREKPKKVIVEFSSPNTAKELHVGHLRSTIIGDSIARLFEFLGHNVLRLNHVGDWGTQFGMLIAYMKERYPKVLTGEQHTDLSYLVKWYKESKLLFDSDPEFKKRSQLTVVDLQSGDPNCIKAWEVLCAISREAYQEIYDLMGIKLIERGESTYNAMLPNIVKECEEKGIVTLSNGAKCIFLDGFTNREGEPLPMILQKSDGGYNYDTTDMAAMKQRTREEKADQIIIITDAGQSLHFQMLEKAAQLAGYLDPKQVQFNHVVFGMVLDQSGKKFRTRSTDTEKLLDLLTAAIEKAKEIVEERALEMSEEEKLELAKKLGLGAIKYSDLSSHRTSDYTFSYEKMLKFEGNTAPFLLYSYVRVSGIKRKIGSDIEQLKQKAAIKINHPSEIDLGLHLCRFSECLKAFKNELLPNRLAEYLFELAHYFNAFYRDCTVEGSKEQEARLLLCELTAQVMEKGLHLLGLQTVQRM